MIATIKIRGLSGQALARLAGSGIDKALAKQFEQGLSVVVVQNGVRVRDYPDGTLETLTENPPAAD